MTQSLLLVGLFLLILVCLPFAITRIKQRYGTGVAGSQGQSRLVSAVAVGPNQRVVTVEVGPDSCRKWLVLGVTAQSVTCLHTFDAGNQAALLPPVDAGPAGSVSAGTTR